MQVRVQTRNMNEESSTAKNDSYKHKDILLPDEVAILVQTASEETPLAGMPGSL